LEPENALALNAINTLSELTIEGLHESLNAANTLNIILAITATLIIGLAAIYFPHRENKNTQRRIIREINELPSIFRESIASGSSSHWVDPEHKIYR